MTDIEIDALSTADLDALIARLGSARIKKGAPQPAELPPIEWTTVDPAWRSNIAPNGFSVIAIRHNAFGWVQFAFPPPERASIACLWLRHQIVPPPQQPEASPPEAAPTGNGSGGGTLH